MSDSSSPRPSQLLAILPRQNIVQDDGVQVLVSTKEVEGAHSDGMLLRRCAFSLSAPFGYVCLGHFRKLSENCWQVSLGTGVLVDEGAARPDRLHATELDALVNLWTSRRQLTLASAL